jgi:phosphatidate cytidylyltransferase
MTSILSKYSNLTQRIVAALIGAIIIIASLFLGPWYYFIVFLTICVLSLLEFYKLVGLDGMIPLKTLGTGIGICLFTFTFLVENHILPAVWYFLLFPLTSLVYLTYLYRKQIKKPFRGAAFTFLGVIYIALPFALLNVILFESGVYTPQLVMGFLFILWANDTGAYFTGVRFGKRKLFERISPKKSWEGFIGGVVFAMGMGYLMSEFTDVLPAWKWLVISIIIVIGGTYGDLIESSFKRSIEIKDSGRLIPGHGGFLDRFDGLLLAVPLITAFLKLV